MAKVFTLKQTSIDKKGVFHLLVKKYFDHAQNVFTVFNIFWMFKFFWSWLKVMFYLVNLHIWVWSKIFDLIQKYWMWSKKFNAANFIFELADGIGIKTFCQILVLSWAEQSGTQFFSLSNFPIVYKSGSAISIQILDIWWATLDIMDDFKLISRMMYFRFGEIKKHIILSFVKKDILILFDRESSNDP